jgi:Ni/Fe-hydrogenase subunit HybB-like protein
MSGIIHHAPVKQPFFTKGVKILIALLAVGLVAAAYRFVFGLSAATNLNNQYPWGIWIAIDVACGVALAAGGFTTAALAHIFHRQRYEAVVRPALLTAMLGYTFVPLALLADLGRYYNLWHPMLPSMWQGNSVLFEVGVCVATYTTVLYCEFAPVVCERFIGRVQLPGALSGLNGVVDLVLRLAQTTLSRIMAVFIIMGVLLSCMHQSSLGALMLIAPYKVNALWYTPILPLLFLMSAMMVGYPMVIFESMVASLSFGRKPEMEVLTPLSRITVFFLGLYGAAKISDLVIRGVFDRVFAFDGPALALIAELGLGVALPLAILSSSRMRRSATGLFTAASLIIGGVVLNRVNVFLVAYRPPFAESVYVPKCTEILVTIGMVAAIMLLYRVAATILPVLPAEETHGASAKPALERA